MRARSALREAARGALAASFLIMWGAGHIASSFLASAPLSASELCGLNQSILKDIKDTLINPVFGGQIEGIEDFDA